MNANLKDLKEEIKSGQAEMRSIICRFHSELKETIQHEMRATIQSVQSELDETVTCNGVTETKPNPGMMQPVVCLNVLSNLESTRTLQYVRLCFSV
jgi:hypothetical protein